MKLKELFKPLAKQEFLIIMFALLLRLPLLDGSFWLDEAAQFLESARPLSEQLNIIPDFQPPLLHLILHFATYLSSTEWWLRLIGSVIPSLIALLATHKLGKKMFDNATANLSCLLLATSSFHIFFSQELRPYSLAAMWASLAFLLLYKQVTSNEHSLKFSYWLPITVVNTLGIYTSYLYPFVIVTQIIIVLIFNKKILKKALTSLAISAILFLPFLPTFIKQLDAGRVLRQSLPGWELVVSHPQLQAIPLTVGKFIFGVIRLDLNTTFIAISTALLSCSAILAIFLYKNFISRKKLQKKWLFLITAIIVTIIIPWLVSFWIPVIQPKRLMFVQPLIYLFITALVTQAWQLKKVTAKILGAILFLLLISLNIFSTYRYYTQKSLQRENWRSLAKYTQARFPAKQTVAVFGFNEPFAPWRLYAQDHFNTLAIENNTAKNKENIQEEIKPIYDYEFVLLFDYLRDLTDPDNQILHAIESFGYEELEVIDYENIGFVRVYIKDKQLLMSYLE